MKKYLIDHWNGNLPLWKSYWVNSWLLVTLIAFIVAFSVGASLAVFSAITGIALSNAATTVIVYMAIMPIAFWFMAGTWRSANAYKVANPKSIWSFMAKVGIVLGVVQYFFAFIAALAG